MESMGPGRYRRDDQSDDIFQVLRLQTHQHLLHTRGFELEHAFGLTPESIL